MKSILAFLYIAKTFGLMPFPLIDNGDGGRKRRLNCNFAHRIPTFIILVFYMLCVSSILWKNRSASEISNTANWIQFFPNAIIFLIVLITADRSRYTIQSVGMMINNLDYKLKPVVISSKAPKERTQNAAFFAIALVITCALSIAILHYLIGVKPTDFVSKFYWMAFVMAKIGLLTFNFMFALYMMILLERLLIIKNTIKWLTDLSISKSMLMKNALDSSNIISTTVIVPSETVYDMLENLYEVVEIIQNICFKMNSYFGKKVIFTVLSAFICLTVQLFYLINNIRNGFEVQHNVLGSAASCSLISTHILELWVIFISGHRVKDTWNILIKRIQGLKRKFAKDESMKSKIDELISIMVFTKVEMRAAGFFNIDLSVITSIASSIATYLVVLLQFKISENDGNLSASQTGDTSQYGLSHS